jgi:predicted permease
MNAVSRDVLFAARLLLRSPTFAVVAILCLGLGMGATTAVYTVVDAVLFRPLPYEQPERLARIYTEFPTFPGGGLPRFPVSPPEFAEMRESLQSFERIDAWQNGAVNLVTATEPIRISTTFVTGTLFNSLGVQPQQGRWISPSDDHDGAPQVILISNGLWRRSFGGSTSVIGRATTLNGLPATIIGVMPSGFQYPPGQVDISEVWAPLQLTAIDLQRRGNHRLGVLARLRPGVKIEQARQELAVLMDRWGQRNADNFHTIHPSQHPVVLYGLHEEMVRTVKPAMLVILGAVGFVLLIACVNVANLLLARAEARQKEISVRVALGVGTARLIRQFLGEGLLIAVAGGLIGLGIAMFGVRLLLWAGSSTIPRAAEVAIDWRALAFTGGVLIATTIVFGLTPLAQALARNTHETLKAAAGRTSATRQATAVRRGLVVSQLSLALVLLVSCGLMVQAFWRLQAVNAGFDPSSRLTMRVALPGAQYRDNAAVKSFVARLEDGLSGLPGVISSTTMSGMPPQRGGDFNDTEIENFVPRKGGPVQNVDYYQFVGHRFFETIGARLVDGRFLDERDVEGAPLSMVVNEMMARTFWPGQSALGRRVRLSEGPNSPWRTIVGVVGDIKNGGYDKPAGTELFVPWRQGRGIRTAQLVIRTAGDPMSVTSAVRRLIGELDPSLPVTGVRSMLDVVALSQSRPRFLSVLLTFFTAIAVGLAAIGVYGVISYWVARRTSEIGIRMAIGADRARILRMVLKEGVALGAAGVLIGLGAAVWLTRFLKTVLFGIDPLDMRTMVVTVALLFALTMMASWIPARRATQVDPSVALRYD